MRYLFYFAHPSHYYTLKPLMLKLSTGDHDIFLFIKTKDILEDLVKESGFPFINISPTYRKTSTFSMVCDVIMRNMKFVKYIKKNKIERIVSCASDIGQAARIHGIESFVFNDDDYFIVPKSAKYGWPFASIIFAPRSCDMGLFQHKTVYYTGYQKLYYLHSNIFKPDIEKVKNHIGNGRYFLLRSVSLEAHHDNNVRGLSDEFIERIIKVLQPHGNVYITSEKRLPENLEKYKLNINPIDIHHYLYCADLLIGDSQSMVHEAAMLGTPSIRYNDFVGRIGVLEELERKYKLTIGISPDEPQKLFRTLEDLLANKNLKEVYKERREKMLSDMIDVNKFAFWFLQNYPDSYKEYKSNPDLQYRFK